MNLRDLEYLDAVATHLHFGKAAKACNVSQPTLSMQIKKLEEHLGVQLFERTNKMVLLTPIGKNIASRAHRTLAEADHIRQAARASRDPLASDLRMGIFPTLAPYLLPTLMPKIKSHFPKLNLLLVEEKTANIIQQLEDGRIDCALLAMPVKSEQLDSIPLFTEDFTLAVPVKHPLAERKHVTPADLKNCNMLLLDEGHCLRDQALEVCHTIGIGEAQHFRATSLETLRHMVASSDSVTLMPKLAEQKNDRHIHYIPFKAPAPHRTIGLYWRKTSGREVLYRLMQKKLYPDMPRF